MTFPEELPISACVREIAVAVDAHPVVIVAGETGSGKTTQLPKICLAMGRGLERRIGVTEPRRIAATSVAARVASELGVEVGREVGYQIRFSNRAGPETYVKFMTDGILLAEIQGDPMLRGYDTLIIDEAHERTLNVDFLLCVVKRLLPKRPDLRVIVSSATLEIERFSSFFDGAPIIQVSGRTFPVETIHRSPTSEESDITDAIANTVEEITTLDPREDILVFLPGEREIREAMDALTEHALPHTVLLPLYGRLSQAEQARVFQSAPDRRIVLATNVAETSLTIPGIVYVIDTGVARINRYSPRSGVTQLLVEPISRASADQRRGRAGRVRSGVCFRLYSEEELASRPAFTDPEVLRVGLAGAILQMRAIGLGSIEDFPLLDPPPKRSVDEGYRVLEEIGALDANRELTEIGRRLAKLPVDPRVGRMILGGESEGALAEVLIIAAALGIQDPRERPLAQQKQADARHARFRDESSDFLGLLRLWRFYRESLARGSQAQARRRCREEFLSYVRLREWNDVHEQLTSIARDMGLRPNARPASDDAVHCAILPGLLSRVARWNAEHRHYVGARQTRFQLHPSSGLAKKPPPWIVAAELVETSQLFGRTAARIDPAWLEALAGPLLKRSYGEPHWAERSAQVMIPEQLSLYGLPVSKDRKVHFGPIDPAASRRLFLIHALVRGEYSPTPTPPFVGHNRAVLVEVAELRARARRSDMVADDDALAVFFEERVPDGVYSGKTFEAWRAVAEAKDPRTLFLSLSDVLQGDASDLSPAEYPTEIELAGTALALTYRFDPGADDDGIAITIPIELLLAIDPGLLDGTIPAWSGQKTLLLLESLPKAKKSSLGSLPELSAKLATSLRSFEEPFLPSLSGAILDSVGETVLPGDFREDELPEYLRLICRIVERGKVIAEARGLRDLQTRFAARAREAWSALPKGRWERDRLTTFDVDTLPDHVDLGDGGARVRGYPGLSDDQDSVSLRLFPSRAARDHATHAGLRRLVLFGLGTTLAKAEQLFPARIAMSSFADAKELDPPRRQLVLRALDEAFDLALPSLHPRSREAFLERFAAGRARWSGVVLELGKLALEVVNEADEVRALLKGLTGGPSAPRAALDDVREQLARLTPPDLFVSVPRERVAHLPRYLRAIRIRLERLPNGPQKDQAKAERVLPLWRDWSRRDAELRARGVSASELDAFRWLLEELRVSIFAPELRVAVPVSEPRLAEMWRRLAGG